MAPRYSIIPGDFATDSRADLGHFRVLNLVGRHTNSHGWCRLKQIKIGDAVGLTRETVNRKIKDLVKWGYIEKRAADATGRAIFYRTLMDRPGSLPSFDDIDRDGPDISPDAPELALPRPVKRASQVRKTAPRRLSELHPTCDAPRTPGVTPAITPGVTPAITAYNDQSLTTHTIPKRVPYVAGDEQAAKVVLGENDRQKAPAAPKANPFADCHDLIPGDTTMEPLWQAQMRAGGRLPVSMTGKRLPFAPSALAKLRRLGVDREKLIERYFACTKGKRIKNPSGYIVRMGIEEVAKRDGITMEQVESMYSEDAVVRAKAQAAALGIEEPRPAIGAAKTSGVALMEALGKLAQNIKTRGVS